MIRANDDKGPITGPLSFLAPPGGMRHANHATVVAAVSAGHGSEHPP